jgi:hypothetical protein
LYHCIIVMLSAIIQVMLIIHVLQIDSRNMIENRIFSLFYAHVGSHYRSCVS